MNRLAVALIGALAGCTIGVSESDYARPGGENTTVRVGGAEIPGELLAVDDDGLLLSAGRGIVLVPYAIVTDVTFNRFKKDFAWPRGRALSGAPLERVRLVSRFPQGVDEGLLGRLLESRRQPELLRCTAGAGEVVSCVP